MQCFALVAHATSPLDSLNCGEDIPVFPIRAGPRLRVSEWHVLILSIVLPNGISQHRIRLSATAAEATGSHLQNMNFSALVWVPCENWWKVCVSPPFWPVRIFPLLWYVSEIGSNVYSRFCARQCLGLLQPCYMLQPLLCQEWGDSYLKNSEFWPNGVNFHLTQLVASGVSELSPWVPWSVHYFPLFYGHKVLSIELLEAKPFLAFCRQAIWCYMIGIGRNTGDVF